MKKRTLIILLAAVLALLPVVGPCFAADIEELDSLTAGGVTAVVCKSGGSVILTVSRSADDAAHYVIICDVSDNDQLMDDYTIDLGIDQQSHEENCGDYNEGHIYCIEALDVTAYYDISFGTFNEACGTVSGPSGLTEQGKTVKLTASALNGFTFGGWELNGELVSTENPYEFKAQSSGKYTPVFINSSHVHFFGEPDFTWSLDQTGCTAVFTCLTCGYTEYVDCALTSETDGKKITLTAAAVMDGAEFKDELVTEIKEEEQESTEIPGDEADIGSGDIMEPADPADPAADISESEAQSSGLKWYWWILIVMGALTLALLAVRTFNITRRKKRKKTGKHSK